MSNTDKDPAAVVYEVLTEMLGHAPSKEEVRNFLVQGLTSRPEPPPYKPSPYDMPPGFARPDPRRCLYFHPEDGTCSVRPGMLVKCLGICQHYSQQ